MKERCVLAHALAPAGTTARQANDLVDEYVDDPGPLAGRQLSVHPLTFTLSPVGFVAQTSSTLERYRGVTLEELAAAGPPDSRYWWQRRK